MTTIQGPVTSNRLWVTFLVAVGAWECLRGTGAVGPESDGAVGQAAFRAACPGHPRARSPR